MAGSAAHKQADRLLCAGTMAHHAPLAELLQNSRDLAGQILALPPLQALARLSCTSRSMCASVARQPESLWQARLAPALAQLQQTADALTVLPCLQAAAAREHGPFHPVLRAPSVRTYLCWRQLVHSSILGEGTADPAPLHIDCPSGSVSPDFLKIAKLGDSKRLLITGLACGQLLQTWALPKSPEALQPASTWMWAACSRLLALPCGDPWRRRSNGEASLLFVDSLTGSCTAVQLQLDASGRPRLTADACPSRSVLVVLCHYEATQVSRASVLCVHDFAGTLVCRMEHDFSGLPICSWAPSGMALLIRVSYPSSVWLWEISSTTAMRLLVSEVEGPPPLAWAVPGSDCVALCQQDRVSFFSTLSAHEEVHRPLPHARWDKAAWGARMALFVAKELSDPAPGCQQLQLLAVQDSGLVLQHTVTAASGQGRFIASTLQVSADGEMCAVVTGMPIKYGMHCLHLAIVHLASGSLREFPLDRTRVPSGAQSVRVCWRDDSSTVLISFVSHEAQIVGTHHVVFSLV